MTSVPITLSADVEAATEAAEEALFSKTARPDSLAWASSSSALARFSPSLSALSATLTCASATTSIFSKLAFSFLVESRLARVALKSDLVTNAMAHCQQGLR
jgi:hypothetical protein